MSWFLSLSPGLALLDVTLGDESLSPSCSVALSKWNRQKGLRLASSFPLCCSRWAQILLCWAPWVPLWTFSLDSHWRCLIRRIGASASSSKEGRGHHPSIFESKSKLCQALCPVDWVVVSAIAQHWFCPRIFWLTPSVGRKRLPRTPRSRKFG